MLLCLRIFAKAASSSQNVLPGLLYQNRSQEPLLWGHHWWPQSDTVSLKSPALRYTASLRLSLFLRSRPLISYLSSMMSCPKPSQMFITFLLMLSIAVKYLSNIYWKVQFSSPPSLHVWTQPCLKLFQDNNKFLYYFSERLYQLVWVNLWSNLKCQQ